ncbi:MAG: hypothetical protein ACTTI1_07360 [Prevotella intermedia]
MAKRKSDVLLRIRVVLSRAYIFITITIPLFARTIAISIATPSATLCLASVFLLYVLYILLRIFGNKHKHYGDGSSLEELNISPFLSHYTDINADKKEPWHIGQDAFMKAVCDITYKYGKEIEENEQQLAILLKWQNKYMYAYFIGGMLVLFASIVEFHIRHGIHLFSFYRKRPLQNS